MLNVAVQLTLLLTVTLPSLQSASPDQPAKTEPEAGVAVSATAVPLAKALEQELPQLMPAGELVIVPLPVPERLSETVKVVAAVVEQLSLE
jgi:hypothetical protein